MNAAGALTVPLLRTNPVPGLATWPVGPATEPGRVTRTVVDLVAVLEPGARELRTELSVPWLEIHSGEVGDSEMPQGFFRSGSATGAMPGISEARLTWFSFRSRWDAWWWPELANAVAGVATRASPPAAAASKTAGRSERSRCNVTHPSGVGSASNSRTKSAFVWIAQKAHSETSMTVGRNGGGG